MQYLINPLRKGALLVRQNSFRYSSLRSSLLSSSLRLIANPLPKSEMDKLTQKLQQLGIKEEFEAFPGSNPMRNPFDLFRSYITNELSTISGVDKSIIYPALEWTQTFDRGDLVIPIPRLRIKDAKPQDLAAQWAEKIPRGQFLRDAVAKGSFIQFYFNPDLVYKTVLKDILTKKAEYGSAEVGKGQRVLIEFSSPNIAKPFHAGHLRSTIIGGFLSNLHEKLGYDVIRMNYLGDWGKQFGVLAVGYERYGDKKKLEQDPINHLFNVYVRVNQDIEAEKAASEGVSKTDDEARAFFKRMDDGDGDALALWKKFRDLSIVKYKETYGRLNINYDEYSGESQVSKERMDEVTEIFKEKGLAIEDNGALLIDLTKHNKKLGKAIVRKKDGTTLYLTRDVGAAIDRYEKYKFDKMIYVVSSQQDLHVAQFFKILDLMGYEWAKNLQHINYGLVQGMSTRKGTVVFLDNILNETKETMHDVMKKNEKKYAQVENADKVADLVGIAAVMVQDMAAKRVNNYKFEWSRMTSFEGDTGPYLQYAHSRLCSMERNAQDNISEADMLNADFSLLKEKHAEELARVLAQFPDVLLQSLKNQEPSTVVTYLFKLTHIVSSCYDVLWVAGQEKQLAAARLALYSAARQVLGNGMRLLGLTPVERM